LRWRSARQIRHGEPHLAYLADFVDGRVAIDVGANNGVYAHLLARLCTDVIAVEPNPLLTARLRRSLPRRVTIIEAALGAESGWSRLMLPGPQNESHYRGSIEPDVIGHEYVGYDVRVLTIDEVSTKPVGFMKIDVEGHEVAVLHGGRRVLMEDQPVVLIEADDRVRKGSSTEIRASLRDLGYRQFDGPWSATQSEWRNLVFVPDGT
jgi:FkbM family methyltransferase